MREPNRASAKGGCVVRGLVAIERDNWNIVMGFVRSWCVPVLGRAYFWPRADADVALGPCVLRDPSVLEPLQSQCHLNYHRQARAELIKGR
jgi:hypothetical protein